MNGVGNHNSQAVLSTGVAGLTATIAAGAFESAGGSLLFSISGTPSQAGVAYFNVIIGGQNCSIEIPVIDATLHTCGTSGVHNAFLNFGSMTDQQGNIYKTIVIGDQEWMAENLNTDIYRNGDDIASNLDNTSWDNTTTGAWSYSMNNSGYACPYGKLYNWYACVDSRQLCPQGWHMPTVADWSILMNYLGGNLVAGGRMKSLALWGDPNTNATNLSGFSGLPGGCRYDYGAYVDPGSYGWWWSSSSSTANDAWKRTLNYSNGILDTGDLDKNCGLSVRCIRD
jgi:uncharacterized protein (TIGR02145 family)